MTRGLFIYNILENLFIFRWKYEKYMLVFLIFRFLKLVFILYFVIVIVERSFLDMRIVKNDRRNWIGDSFELLINLFC